MTNLCKSTFRSAVILLLTSATCYGLASCCIDEDLSGCGAEFVMKFDLRVVSNMSTELQTVLSDEDDRPVADALRAHLANIFTDRGYDLDLSFYDTEADSIRLHHEQHIMDASETTYSLYLPVHNYMHTALVNLANNPAVSFIGDERCHAAQLSTVNDGTLRSHTTGLFTARMPMDVTTAEEQHFFVHLYMSNCATALVLDTTACDVRDIRILTSGFADGFRLADSLFTYNSPVTLHATRVPVATGRQACFCSVSFPSPETPATRLIIETVEPFLANDADEALWQYQCFVTLANGTTTQTTLNMRRPLRAGQLKIIKAWLDDHGVVRTEDMTIGVSVTLDWKSGGEYNPIL